MRISTQTISLLKGERPIVAVTAYDAIIARYADEAGVDLILVGDSVGTTQLGFETTIPVTLEMMLHHTAAVARTPTTASHIDAQPPAATVGPCRGTGRSRNSSRRAPVLV